MSYEPEVPPPMGSAAAEKVNLPGIFLLVTGIINVLGALILLYIGFQVQTTSPEEFKKAQQEMTPEQKKQMEETGLSMEQLKQYGAGLYLGWGAIALIASIVTIWGAIKMRSLQSYGLSVTASVLAVIPCVTSPCCLLGLPIGIWALVVLLNQDVKAAFR